MAKTANGTACAASNPCTSGQCVDGVCCDSACDGACNACNLSGFVGTCTVLTVGGSGSPSCAPYVCGGASASCPVTCTANSQCAYGSYCNGATCVSWKSNGATCAAGNECASGNCADGVCCDTACGGACDACNVTGSVGTCAALTAGNPGSPSCAPYVCGGASASCPVSCTADSQCAFGNYCAGTTCAPKKSNSGTCTAGNQCASGNCVDGVCCNTACGGACDACNVTGSVGTCSAVAAGSGGSPSCAPFVCGGASASCPASCTADTQCAAGNYCNGTTCVARKTNGVTCTAGNQCGSGNCVDGVCCNTACGGACDACNVAGSVGVCSNVTAGSSGSPACAPYVCGGASASCPVACTTDSQCSFGNYCGSGTCVAKKSNSGTCTAGNQCSSGNCVDGVCCNTACGGACDACNVTGSVGTCAALAVGTTGSPSCAPYVCNGTAASCPTSCTADSQCAAGNYCNGTICVAKVTNGPTCTANNQCLSGNCVDGVCCNTACGGACDACNLTGSVGTCAVRTAGSSGTPSCGTYVCNGSSTSRPGSCTADSQCSSGNYCNGTSCVAKLANGPTCTSNNQCLSGNCVDGVCCNTACGGGCDACNVTGSVGTCAVRTAGSAGNPSCGTYVCNGTSASCPASCTSDSQCSSGNYCGGGTCVAKKANAGTCTAGNQCSSGNCVGGYCCGQAFCSDSCDAWGACSYADPTCSNSGTQSQRCTSYTCSTGTCAPSGSYTNTSSAGCGRNTDGTYCDSSYGDWGSCTGSGSCPTAGSHSRSVTNWFCGAGTCSVSRAAPRESGECTINPAGQSCGATTVTDGTCNPGSGSCPTAGTQTPRQTSYTCSASGACLSTTVDLPPRTAPTIRRGEPAVRPPSPMTLVLPSAEPAPPAAYRGAR